MKLFSKRGVKVHEAPRGRTPLRQRPGGNPTVDTRPAFSYYAQRSASSSNTGRRDPTELALDRDSSADETLGTRYRVIFGVLAIAVLIAAGYVLTLSPKPHVILLQDQTTAFFLHPSSVYQQTAEQTLDSTIFNRNKLTVDTAAVRLSLLRKYPEIKNVSVVMPVFGHQPQVYIEPYKPSFILMTTSSGSWLLDSTGRALALTSQIPGIAKLGVPTLQDSGLNVKLGSPALPSTVVSFTQTIITAFKSSGVSTSSLVLPSAYELDAHVSGTSYFIKFNLQNDVLQQVGTYLAVSQQLTRDHIVVGQYIDVRVPGRAYYK